MEKDDIFVVCAALRSTINPERIITGIRHYCPIMRQQILASEGISYWKCNCDQGFMDNRYNFISREEAWILAEKQGQIRREVSTPGKLYSENLY